MRKKGAAWKWLSGVAVLSALIVYFVVWSDPLFRLGLELNEHPMWLTGFATMVKLPSTATPDEIIAEEMRLDRSANDISPCKIVEKGSILIFPERCLSAAVIETEAGKKMIKTYRYMVPANMWWVKTYDMP